MTYKEEKQLHAEVVIYGKGTYSVCEIMKKEKEIHASFSIATHTAKVMARVCDTCLVKMEKSLTLYNKILREAGGDHIPIIFIVKLCILKPHSHNFLLLKLFRLL